MLGARKFIRGENPKFVFRLANIDDLNYEHHIEVRKRNIYHYDMRLFSRDKWLAHVDMILDNDTVFVYPKLRYWSNEEIEIFNGFFKYLYFSCASKTTVGFNKAHLEYCGYSNTAEFFKCRTSYIYEWADAFKRENV